MFIIYNNRIMYLFLYIHLHFTFFLEPRAKACILYRTKRSLYYHDVLVTMDYGRTVDELQLRRRFYSILCIIYSTRMLRLGVRLRFRAVARRNNRVGGGSKETRDQPRCCGVRLWAVISCGRQRNQLFRRPKCKLKRNENFKKKHQIRF